MRQKIKIPGIIFLIVPILLWIGYINYDFIVCSIEQIELTWEIIPVSIFTLAFSMLIEVLLRGTFDKLPESPLDLFTLRPIAWIIDILIYINKKLTVEV